MKFLDLSYSLSNTDKSNWPGNSPFRLTTISESDQNPMGCFLASVSNKVSEQLKQNLFSLTSLWMNMLELTWTHPTTSILMVQFILFYCYRSSLILISWRLESWSDSSGEADQCSWSCGWYLRQVSPWQSGKTGGIWPRDLGEDSWTTSIPVHGASPVRMGPILLLRSSQIHWNWQKWWRLPQFSRYDEFKLFLQLQQILTSQIKMAWV